MFRYPFLCFSTIFLFFQPGYPAAALFYIFIMPMQIFTHILPNQAERLHHYQRQYHILS